MEFQDPYDHDNPDLIYTPENIATTETEEELNEQFIEGCKCEENCSTQNKCTCILKSGAYYLPSEKTPENIRDNYTINITDLNKPIYECNANCKCYGKVCGNRLVQFGPRKFLQVIVCPPTLDDELSESTSSKKLKLDKNLKIPSSVKGMGLTTTENIKEGNFICEYAGEIITKTEAIKRHEGNEKLNLMNYIFCINEFCGESHLNTYIDPSKFGNIGRYLNHSCQPNCKLIPIRVNNIIPKLCIFAGQDIEKNCELTFDYGNDNLKISETGNDQNRIKCLCGTTLCRKYLPFSKYTT